MPRCRLKPRYTWLRYFTARGPRSSSKQPRMVSITGLARTSCTPRCKSWTGDTVATTGHRSGTTWQVVVAHMCCRGQVTFASASRSGRSRTAQIPRVLNSTSTWSMTQFHNVFREFPGSVALQFHCSHADSARVSPGQGGLRMGNGSALRRCGLAADLVALFLVWDSLGGRPPPDADLQTISVPQL